MGNGQWAMGNGQWAMGNGQWAMGIKRSFRIFWTMPDAQCPMPNAHCPIPYSPPSPFLEDLGDRKSFAE
jgi:hypothetical protein